MNERIIDKIKYKIQIYKYMTVNISTHIHNERIKTKYIPSYIFENEGKIFKKLKKLAVMCSYAHSITLKKHDTMKTW